VFYSLRFTQVLGRSEIVGNNTSEINERSYPGKLVLPSLAIAGAPMEPPGILTNLLLIEIGLTFGCPIGLAGQIKTTSSTVGIIMALIWDWSA
jgi:hypothetical protein